MALVGFGTVGRAVAKILCESGDQVAAADAHLQSQCGKKEAAVGSRAM